MWGEIKDLVDESEDKNVNISDVIEQAQHPYCLSNYDIAARMNETREIRLPTMDPKLLYSAELHTYKYSMRDVIEDAELAVEFNLTLQKTTPDCSLPDKPAIKPKITISKPMNFIEKRDSDFTKGKGKKPPFLSDFTRRLVEQQCIATLFAQVGFKSTYDDVMDTLTDILEVFYKNICGQLRIANDSELNNRCRGFPDIVDQVLTQSGLGGLQGIHDYYETRINKYQAVLEERCRTLSEKYKLLVTPDHGPRDIKIEKLDDGFMDEEDIPEVHFTAIDGEGDYLQPFLESGFQMLNSLEEGQFVT